MCFPIACGRSSIDYELLGLLQLGTATNYLAAWHSKRLGASEVPPPSHRQGLLALSL